MKAKKLRQALQELAEEGVVFDDVLIVEDGAMREHAIRDLLASGPYPARNIDQNIADLAAQVAACARGAEGLRQLAAQQGQGVVTRYMAYVQAHAEAMARRMIATLSDGTFRYALEEQPAILGLAGLASTFSRWEAMDRMEIYGGKAALDRVEALASFADAHGHTLLELAFAWLLSSSAVASVIAGARTVGQVMANAGAATWRLSPAPRSSTATTWPCRERG